MSKDVLNEFVLMLNKSWVPIDTCSVRSAFSRICVETARFLDTDGDAYALYEIDEWINLPIKDGMSLITTAKSQIRVPEILVLQSDMMPKRRVMQFSRRNLARRDRMTCQYCSARPGGEKLTVDHVVPRAQGGRSSWENCVLSCLGCNASKADRTPEQAEMRLKVRPEQKIAYPNDKDKWVKPYVPAWSPVFKVSTSNLKESWKQFLPEKVLETMNIV